MILRPKTNPEKRPAPRPPNGGRACGFSRGKSTRVKHAPNLFFDPAQIRVMKFSTKISQADSPPPAQAEIPLPKPPKINNFLRPENCKDFTFGPPDYVQTLQNTAVSAQ